MDAWQMLVARVEVVAMSEMVEEDTTAVGRAGTAESYGMGIPLGSHLGEGRIEGRRAEALAVGHSSVRVLEVVGQVEL